MSATQCPQAGSESKLDRSVLASAPFDVIPLLCEERALDLWDAWYGARKPPLPNPRRVIADTNLRAEAAVDGLGWAMADNLMQREFDQGLLVAPFEHRLDGFEYAVQTAPGRFLSQGALQLRNWLVGSVLAQPADYAANIR